MDLQPRGANNYSDPMFQNCSYGIPTQTADRFTFQTKSCKAFTQKDNAIKNSTGITQRGTIVHSISTWYDSIAWRMSAQQLQSAYARLDGLGDLRNPLVQIMFAKIFGGFG